MYEEIIKNKFCIEGRIEWQSNQRENNNIKNNCVNIRRKCSESAVYTRKVKSPEKYYYMKMSERNLSYWVLFLLFGIFLNTQFGYTHGLIVRDSSNNGEYRIFIYKKISTESSAQKLMGFKCVMVIHKFKFCVANN